MSKSLLDYNLSLLMMLPIWKDIFPCLRTLSHDMRSIFELLNPIWHLVIQRYDVWACLLYICNASRLTLNFPQHRSLSQKSFSVANCKYRNHGNFFVTYVIKYDFSNSIPTYYETVVSLLYFLLIFFLLCKST